MSAKLTIPPFPPTVRGQAQSIKTDPKGQKLIYTHGRLVVTRDVAPTDGNPIQTMLYTEHQYAVTAAAIAPSGCYMASGDERGTVRVWACDMPEKILKLETTVFGGAVLDIAWSPDSQRICAVGNGQQQFGKVFMWDSGNTVGEISGHSKKITTCSMKSSRPFRIATGSDDLGVNIYNGPPFKFAKKMKVHDRFVNCVRFSPDGARIISVASDMMAAVFDGKEGDLLIEKKVAGGSIYSAAWTADSSKVVIACADKKTYLLDAATLEAVGCFEFGKSIEDMQVACAYCAASDSILSYSLGGQLSLFDSGSLSSGPKSVQVGHNMAICSLAISGGYLVSGGSSSIDEQGSTTSTSKGCMRAWDLATATAQPFAGKGHSARILALAALKDGTVVSVGVDDKAIFSSTSPLAYGVEVGLSAAARGLGCGGELAVVPLCNDKVAIINGARQASETALTFSPSVAAVDLADSCIAVGADGFGDNFAVAVLSPSGAVVKTLSKHRGAISALAFTADSARLASACSNKEIVVWDPREGTPLITGLQGYHSARVSSLAWSAAGVLASGGVDQTVLVWDLDNKKTKHTMKLAHQGGVTAVCFVSEDTLASAGLDACIKLWAV